ncbi:MAG TPA: PD-(D/E)XK nuclease family protein, partial [Candidatus Elarobacter sp.]|nr:PD-(D/E)XK nuclease family protein [Candidatus Elarobacter sp.]
RRKLGPRAAGLPLGGLFRTAREASLEDPFLFFLALSMAERELVLSYPEANEQGNPTVPSPFLDEVQATAAGPLPRTALEATALVPPGEECCELAELVGRASLARWARHADAPPDRLTAALAETGPALAGRLAAIDRRAALEERRSRYFLCGRGDPRKDALADAFVGRVAVPPELAAHLAAMRWTPTRLEALGACGFKFYAREVLGLAPEDDPEAQVGALERGTLAHAVLEALFRAHPRLPADLAAARALGQALVAQTRERAARTIVAKDPWLFDVAWGRVAAAVDALIGREHAEERAWGGTIERIVERPVERALADPGGGPALTLAGTPDRVDLFRDGAAICRLRVVDYKMSRSPTRYAARIDPARELGKTGFQIPVYLLGALAAVEGLADEAELSGGYLVLEAERMPQVRNFPRPLLDDLAARITALVGRARAGRFDVDPEPCDPYCPYRAVCRYQRPPLEEETAGG